MMAYHPRVHLTYDLGREHLDYRWVSNRELMQFSYIGLKNAQQLRKFCGDWISVVDVAGDEKLGNVALPFISLHDSPVGRNDAT